MYFTLFIWNYHVITFIKISSYFVASCKSFCAWTPIVNHLYSRYYIYIYVRNTCSSFCRKFNWKSLITRKFTCKENFRDRILNLVFPKTLWKPKITSCIPKANTNIRISSSQGQNVFSKYASRDSGNRAKNNYVVPVSHFFVSNSWPEVMYTSSTSILQLSEIVVTARRADSLTACEVRPIFFRVYRSSCLIYILNWRRYLSDFKSCFIWNFCSALVLLLLSAIGTEKSILSNKPSGSITLV